MSSSDWAGLSGPLFYGGIGIAIAALGWSGIAGERGMRALERTQQTIALEQTRLDRLATERQAAENLARRLSTQHLDLDLLDEQARSVLGYVRPDEIVLEPVAR